MIPLRVLSASEQVAEYLRQELLCGTWVDTMPGESHLVAQLGVGRDTVKMALKHLERDGLLVPQGVGRRRKIALSDDHTAQALRVAVMLFESEDKGLDFQIQLNHQLEKAGYMHFFADKTLSDLGRNTGRIARFVKKTEADAWIVSAGSREILQWFTKQELPAFALFGARDGLPIASTGPDKSQPLVEATRRLLAHGHCRISLLCRREHRLPKPVPALRCFLDELEAAGIVTGTFNLPNWEENREGFEQLLDSLFNGPPPPTALIIDEPFLYNACFHYLAGRSLRVPQDISLICTDGDSDFDWCQPSISHIRWDYRLMIRRVVSWANNVSQGKEDLRQTYTKAEFIEGGTMGKAP
jgi:LacI family transcriptional regulator